VCGHGIFFNKGLIVELVIANTREIKSMSKRLCGITKCVLIFCL
jgi:hypothetical protein